MSATHPLTNHQPPNRPPFLPVDLIAGALFDFCGYITAGDDRLLNDPPVLVERLKTWAAARGLSLEHAETRGWDRLITEQLAAVFVFTPAHPLRDQTLHVLLEAYEERHRQIQKGYTEARDDALDDASLAKAAGCYALAAAGVEAFALEQDGPGEEPSFTFYNPWPFTLRKDKRREPYRQEVPMSDSRRRLMVEAMAYLVAEIERLDRARWASLTPATTLGAADPDPDPAPDNAGTV